MDLQTIEMPVEEAQAAFEEYRDALKADTHARYCDVRNEYERLDRAIMRGYKEIAKGNPLIKLSEAVVAGGAIELTWTHEWWQDGRIHRQERSGIFPRIAVCRADARHCFTTGVNGDGVVIFRADNGRKKADQIVVEGFEGPEKVQYRSHRAIVPTIPPPFRPPHKLSGYHILWEADWENVAPEDPALLKHLGGDLYAVLAVWDLTELERAVLGGLRSE
jgi:hypothetical protein